MVVGIVVERVAQLIRVFIPSEGRELRGIPRGRVLARFRVYAGDRVEGKCTTGDVFLIERILERRNVLVRPPVANVDRVICVVTLREPDFDSYLLDSLLVVYDHAGCESVVLFNKVDLLNEEERAELDRWTSLYRSAGYETVEVSARTGEGLEKIAELVKGEICILAGPSGTGKSSLLRRITGAPLRTGEVSEKTGRGRHTTTGVRLIPFGKDSFLADTPGFSKVDPLRFVRKRDVRLHFREFLRYRCRYPDCTHIREPDCGVREAVKRREVSCERYKSYLKMVREYIEELREICD